VESCYEFGDELSGSIECWEVSSGFKTGGLSSSAQLHSQLVILKNGNSNTKSLAYMSLVSLILQYGAPYRDPYREGQINALHRMQNKRAKFAHFRNDLNWETLAQCRKIARICALFKAYTGERAWEARLITTHLFQNVWLSYHSC
jgi:hypothetical protein